MKKTVFNLIIKKFSTISCAILLSSNVYSQEAELENLMNSAKLKFEQSKYREADEDYTKILGLFPNITEAHLKRGISRMKINHYEGARADLQMVISADPLNKSAYLYLADAEELLGNYFDAIKHYDKVLAMHSNDTMSIGKRALAKFNMGNYKNALVDYTAFLLLKPNDVEGLLHRGLAKEHLGDQIGAIADYTHLISVSHKDIRAFYNRGNAKNLLGQYHEAYEDFVKVIEIAPNDPDALINKAHLEYVFGKYDIALQNCNKAISLGLDNEDAHFTRATIYEHLKLMKEALADLDRVLVINPVNSYALLFRGMYKLKLKDASACADLKKALELGEEGALKLIKKNCK